MSFKVFIDTEFTDFINVSLISIGMVADSGEEFYAEIPYPPNECSPFVHEAVIPLLGRFPDAACSQEALPERLLTWLEKVKGQHEQLEICFDYQTDWDLFNDTLEYRVPEWCRPRNVVRNINELLSYTFHKKNNFPQHHALYDARANRYAYRERPDISS
ncbi:3'-5' exoribonuclease [Herbaspirillum sp. RTI4]|uniref:3'-5' exoribonuclease n=1 Tax=Herbaspirillum sp. RTI4 TaxID=3048640 RepID=UPI002AB51537|nr:3'-5' exoribonuclease [Herbaspirillum sp. RTI4]MDY7577274.1 3'-5' exoribonuclease [Herbaspirillum sp. RTI4]MEA9983538.1 3'-5' exoribonuclease [Herbaspirillum sp. RTI4]